MKIYTGYFDALETYVENGLNPISIAGLAPCYYEGREWKFLAPKLSTYTRYKNGEINEFGYMEEYIPTRLDVLDKQELKQKIDEIENPIFLCYEKEGFCHRHLFADWLENNLGYMVEEYKVD